MRRRTLGIVLVAVGLIGLIGTAWAFAARPGYSPGSTAWGRFIAAGGGPTCTGPALPGQTVRVVLSDMGGMIGGGMMWNGRMGNVAASPSAVSSGEVPFSVWNAGMMVHELVVLPLPSGGVGTRPVGADGRVSEAGGLGEASKSCGEGTGEGIVPGAASWVTLHLAAGRYELMCNEPGHYAMGMHTELDVR